MYRERSISDEELINDILDEQRLNGAIRHILESYHGLLEHMVVSNSGTPSDAEDVIQDTLVAFVEIIRKGTYRREAGIKSFLYTIARNLWITELRKRGSAVKRELLYEKSKDVTDEELMGYLSYKDIQKTVTDLLNTLEDKCKQILRMVYFDNLPMREMVAKLGYQNEQVVRNKKHKCMKELERKINDSPAAKRELKNLLLHGN